MRIFKQTYHSASHNLAPDFNKPDNKATLLVDMNNRVKRLVSLQNLQALFGKWDSVKQQHYDAHEKVDYVYSQGQIYGEIFANLLFTQFLADNDRFSDLSQFKCVSFAFVSHNDSADQYGFSLFVNPNNPGEWLIATIKNPYLENPHQREVNFIVPDASQLSQYCTGKFGHSAKTSPDAMHSGLLSTFFNQLMMSNVQIDMRTFANIMPLIENGLQSTEQDTLLDVFADRIKEILESTLLEKIVKAHQFNLTFSRAAMQTILTDALDSSSVFYQAVNRCSMLDAKQIESICQLRIKNPQVFLKASPIERILLQSQLASLGYERSYMDKLDFTTIPQQQLSVFLRTVEYIKQQHGVGFQLPFADYQRLLHCVCNSEHLSQCLKAVNASEFSSLCLEEINKSLAFSSVIEAISQDAPELARLLQDNAEDILRHHDRMAISDFATKMLAVKVTIDEFKGEVVQFSISRKQQKAIQHYQKNIYLAVANHCLFDQNAEQLNQSLDNCSKGIAKAFGKLHQVLNLIEKMMAKVTSLVKKPKPELGASVTAENHSLGASSVANTRQVRFFTPETAAKQVSQTIREQVTMQRSL